MGGLFHRRGMMGVAVLRERVQGMPHHEQGTYRKASAQTLHGSPAGKGDALKRMKYSPFPRALESREVPGLAA